MGKTTREVIQSEGIVPIERIAARIYVLQGYAGMFASDLADLYGVETRVLIQAVKRNIERFPPDFMFQLTREDLENWRSQIVMTNPAAKMGLRREPYVFTEQGVAMLSSVLRSKRAVEVNIGIMRTFVKMRRVMATNEELARKVAQHDEQIGVLFDHVGNLLEAPEPRKKNPIGFLA
jgi:ORF6N domain